jgi:sulfatase maturation enzyme AslB (radical SAM superfamily)
VPFAATGEFFMDPHALDHLRAAVELGHQPSILTNGLLLTPALIDEILRIGVRFVAISVDAIDHDQYRRIRRGGDFQLILDACAHLRSRKSDYPDIRVEINNVLFKATHHRQQEYVDFWRGKVDAVSFNAEYYDTFKFRNTIYDRGERVDCQIRAFLMPTGRITPCCAMTVYQHDRDVSWLPHIAEMPLDEAQTYMQRLYDDPESPLGRLCKTCDWWILFKRNEQGDSPYLRTVFFGSDAGDDARKRSQELAEAGTLARATLNAVSRLLRISAR